jgi:CDP-glucose 4,6-dehydratase
VNKSKQRILVTGHTGFKGAWFISNLFLRMRDNFQVFGLGLNINNSLYDELDLGDFVTEFNYDISDKKPVERVFAEVRPTIVVHMAAQAIVSKGYSDPYNTFTSNGQGTLNIIDCISKCDEVSKGLIVTTDKVYKQTNNEQAFQENAELWGDDPYSASKVVSEQIIHSYKASGFLKHCSIAVARAGNVVGGGDYSSDRIFPDIYRAMQKGEKLLIRNPNATRPWQHVQDCCDAYINILQNMHEFNIDTVSQWNIAPSEEKSLTVGEIIDEVTNTNTRLKFRYMDNPIVERQYLSLSSKKINTELLWRPKYTQLSAIQKTLDWYQNKIRGTNMQEYTMKEILSYYEK